MNQEEILQLIKDKIFLVIVSPTRLDDTTLPETKLVIGEDKAQVCKHYTDKFPTHIIQISGVEELRYS